MAVLLVIAYHCVAGGSPPPTLIDKAFEGIAGRAWVGVDLFFVLSGFLITGILLDTRGKTRYFQSFYPRRMLRTFPLYYATLVVCFLVLPLIPAASLQGLQDLSERQGWFWLHVSNFYTVFHNVLVADGPEAGWMKTFWSLAVEEHFYLVWPLLVFWLRPKALARTCVILFLGTLALRMALVANGTSYGVLYYSTFTRLDGLLLGSLVAVFSRRKAGLAGLLRPARVLLFASGAALAILSWVQSGRFGFLGQTLLFSFVALFFASLMVVVLESPGHSRLKKFFSNAVLRSCGKYSYAMYILNIPLLHLLGMFFVPDQHRVWGSRLPATILFMAVGAALAWGGSQVTWHLLEKHCLKLKRYFVAGTPRVLRSGPPALTAAPAEPQ